MPHASPRPVPSGRLRRLRSVAVLALGLAAVGAVAVAAPASAVPVPGGTPTLVVAPTDVAPGDPVEVAVTLPDVSDAYAVELTLDVDPAVLALVEGSADGPAGGFDTARQDAGTVALAHTRLGSSPGLEGDVVLTAQLLALAPGDSAVALAGVTLVGADGVVVALPADGLPTVAVTVAAPPVAPEPSPTPTDPAGGAAPTALPSPSASVAPAASGAAPAGDLAWTGSDLGPIVGVAGAAALLGALALAASVLRQRRLARTDRVGAGE